MRNPTSENAAIIQTAVPKSSLWLRYFLAMGLTLAVLESIPFILGFTPLYERLNQSFNFQFNSYPFHVLGGNADIVIFGESSAQGLDPIQMSRELGKNVLILPGHLSELITLQDFTLRRYLQADKPPQMIVFYLAPWNMNVGYQPIGSKPLYDTMEILFRYGTPSEKLNFAMKYPKSTLLFPPMFYRVNGQEIISGGRKPMVIVAGQRQESKNGSPHETYTCRIPDDYLRQMGNAWVLQMIRQYTTPQTKVLAIEAPFARCVNAAEVLSTARKDAPVIPAVAMDPDLFEQDKFYIHPFPVAIPSITERLIQYIRPMLDQASTAAQNPRMVETPTGR